MSPVEFSDENGKEKQLKVRRPRNGVNTKPLARGGDVITLFSMCAARPIAPLPRSAMPRIDLRATAASPMPSLFLLTPPMHLLLFSLTKRSSAR